MLITADGWSADTTKQGYLGLTGHWIDVTGTGKWVLRSEVVGFRALSGAHSGDNLGRYCVGLCDRVGITGREQSKVLYTSLLILDQELMYLALYLHSRQYLVKRNTLRNY